MVKSFSFTVSPQFVKSDRDNTIVKRFSFSFIPTDIAKHFPAYITKTFSFSVEEVESDPVIYKIRRFK